jgi:ABC-type branched-subunit amino acid transport system ATPase component
LQGISLSLSQGVLGVVGRNGMGKTTLCNAITGLVPASGSVRLAGEEILGMPPHDITRRGIAYVPQGRRVWPSLTVDETLRLVAAQRRDVDRVYAMFPRLAERRSNGGSQLSGGEQQMLAIGRALLLKPRVLVMDEPTEGLAPVIVEQMVHMILALKSQGVSILLSEQNMHFAELVSDRAYVLEKGQIRYQASMQDLAANEEVRRNYLSV